MTSRLRINIKHDPIFPSGWYSVRKSLDRVRILCVISQNQAQTEGRSAVSGDRRPTAALGVSVVIATY